MHYCLDIWKCKEIRINKQFQNNFVIFRQIESNIKPSLEMNLLSFTLICLAKSWSNLASRGYYKILKARTVIKKNRIFNSYENNCMLQNTQISQKTDFGLVGLRGFQCCIGINRHEYLEFQTAKIFQQIIFALLQPALYALLVQLYFQYNVYNYEVQFTFARIHLNTVNFMTAVLCY